MSLDHEIAAPQAVSVGLPTSTSTTAACSRPPYLFERELPGLKLHDSDGASPIGEFQGAQNLDGHSQTIPSMARCSVNNRG